jgi:hypothetical protein
LHHLADGRGLQTVVGTHGDRRRAVAGRPLERDPEVDGGVALGDPAQPVLELAGGGVPLSGPSEHDERILDALDGRRRLEVEVRIVESAGERADVSVDDRPDAMVRPHPRPRAVGLPRAGDVGQRVDGVEGELPDLFGLEPEVQPAGLGPDDPGQVALSQMASSSPSAIRPIRARTAARLSASSSRSGSLPCSSRARFASMAP